MVHRGLPLNGCRGILMMVLVLGLLGPMAHRAAAQDDIIQAGDRRAQEWRSRTQTGAIAIVRDIPGETITKALADELPNRRRRCRCRSSPHWPTATTQCSAGGGPGRPIRGRVGPRRGAEGDRQLGDVSSVPLLAQRASETRGAEQKAARDSLYRLRGSEISPAILANLTTSEPAVKVELIRRSANAISPPGSRPC